MGQWVTDSVLVYGGFGTGETGLFDPVDMASHHLDLFILDRSESRISRFDTKLNFIQSIPLSDDTGELFPTRMSLDSRGRINIYSPETHAIYRMEPNSSRLHRFIDLNNYPAAENCVASLRFARNDQMALLIDCMNEILLFTRSGKLERRFRVDIKNPIFILSFNHTWMILNKRGDAQFLGEYPFILPLKDSVILDVVVDEGFLNILTENELVIFNLNVRQ